MPDKSCRTCGGELIKWSACSDCRKVTQKICRVCNLKTVEEIHFHHISLETYKILETKNTIATIQSYSNSSGARKHRKKNYGMNQIRNNILVVMGITMGVIFLSIGSMSYLGLTHNNTTTEIKTIPQYTQVDTIQTIKETHYMDTIQSEATIPTYSNCLGNADGISLTITCPTTYGNVYKAVVDIPSDLIYQFESKVFNMRGLSITEHVNSVSIQYEKRTYETKFVSG